MSGNGWLCDKVRILFWNRPKSSPFFHAGCASCGVLAGDSGASVAENRGGFWEILAANFGRFWSSFRRFSWAYWGRTVGGGLVLASRRARGDEKRCIRQHALWDAPKKGIMGWKSVENLPSARRRVGAALRVGGGVRRFSLRGRDQPLSDGAEVEFRGRFLVRKGGRLTGWDDYLWVYSSYSLMYSITRSMASGRMSLMRGLLTQSYTMG